MPFIVSVVGFSQSGKTTLIQEMIPLLRAKGYQVAVIKHTDKKIAEAPAGKDTFQFNQAGAQAVGLWGADGFTLTKSPGEAAAPALEQAAFYLCPEVDILLTEGFKEANTPKILILTPGQEDRLVTEVRGVIIATVGPEPFKEELPHFQAQEAGRLVEMLELRFLKERREPRLRVWLDGKRIPMKDFVQDIIIQGIMGMLGTLRGVIPAKRVDITLSPQKPASKGKLGKHD
jgi:molybdopterin-guanine dinucleotide biosynthesis protein B